MNKIVIGIDVGGSTTKIVGLSKKENETKLLEPQFVRATDPLTSIYGAFGKFTYDNHLSLQDISKIYMTGAGSDVLAENGIYGHSVDFIPEFSASGKGGLYLSGLDEAIVVSMGTGTAVVHAKKQAGNYSIKYLGGTGVGGGTLLGLSHKLLRVDDIENFQKLCAEGNLDNVDLRVKDISKKHAYKEMNEDLTASNFGKVNDLATHADLALGIANMVAESVAMLALFAARAHNTKNIVLIGNLTTLKPIQDVFNNLSKTFDVSFIIPDNSQFGTVIGAALTE